MKRGKRPGRALVLSALALAALAGAAALILTRAVIPGRKYRAAAALLASGDYAPAYALLEELGREEEIAASKALRGEALLASGDYETAYALLREAGRDDIAAASRNERADALLEAGDLNGAYALLAGLPDAASREKRMEIKRRQIDETPVGRSFTLGLYEQDNDRNNGPEPIRWIVLAREGDRVLAVSRYVLDCRLYDEERRPVTWETCTLRAWLNGEFLNAAFDPDEQALIRSTRVSPDPNPVYDVDPGAEVEDKLFLLSIREVEACFLPDAANVPKWERYDAAYPELLCEPTAYGAANGCAPQSENGSARWWLRTPGLSSSSAAWVSRTGGIRQEGSMVDCCNSQIVPGIRPAMWIGPES